MISLLLIGWSVPLMGWASTPTILHSFTGTGSDGSNPYASLTLSANGTTLYGTTYQGGTSNDGAIFSIDLTNSHYTTLHSFTGVGTDGSNPDGNLIFSNDGTKLYGMTLSGGASSNGTVISISLSNNTCTTLHSFTGSDGSTPYGSLTLSSDGTKLYGMSSGGGDSGDGVVFSINLSNSNQYSIIHTFTNTGDDGALPWGSLTLSSDGTKLYGMTSGGGDNGNGAVFSIDLSNNNYTTLHSFTGTDGSNPYGSLTLSGDGTKLYGMTYSGSASNDGAVFSINLSNNNLFTTIHSFTGIGTDGSQPWDRLTLSGDGSILYGMTFQGGSSNDGVIFSITISSDTYSTLYSFTGGTDGANPQGNLTLSGDGTSIYGTASGGGAFGDGVIFSFPLSASTTACTADLDGNLALHIPYITYSVPLLGTLSLSADLTYVANPALIVFKYINSDALSNPSFSCTAATLSTSLVLHIPDVLFPDGITHVWADLTYNAALSADGNVYFAVTNFGYL